jgi:hypothetical protein
MNKNWFHDRIHSVEVNNGLLYWNTPNAFVISTAKNASSLLSQTTGINSKTLKISYDNINDFQLENNEDYSEYLKVIKGKSKKRILILIRNPYNRFLAAFNSDTFGSNQSSFFREKDIENKILEFVKDEEFNQHLLEGSLFTINNKEFIEKFKDYYKKIYYIFLKKYFEDGVVRESHNSNYLFLMSKIIDSLEKNNIQYSLVDLDRENTNDLIIEKIGINKLSNFTNTNSYKNYFLHDLLNTGHEEFIKKIQNQIVYYLFDECMIYNDLSKKCINYK